MKYEKKILNKAFSNAVDSLNEVRSLDNKFIYQYDYHNDWFNIIHSIENEIQANDEIAKTIGDILYKELLSKDIFNFSIFEDKKIISENTYEFVSNNRNEIHDKFIKAKSKFGISNVQSKPTKKVASQDLKIA